jgi:hypothetical protein
MKNIKVRVMESLAVAAEKACNDAMGFASRGGLCEPKMPETAKQESKIEHIFKKHMN